MTFQADLVYFLGEKCFFPLILGLISTKEDIPRAQESGSMKNIDADQEADQEVEKEAEKEKVVVNVGEIESIEDTKDTSTKKRESTEAQVQVRAQVQVLHLMQKKPV